MSYDREQLEAIAQAEAEWEAQEKIERELKKSYGQLIPYQDDLN